MSRDAQLQQKAPEQLRAELKKWENDFAKANGGRKPSKEDIKKNATIVAKYREYNNSRDGAKKQQTTPRKSTKPTPKKAEHNALRERSTNAVAATPSRRSRHEKGIQPPELAHVPEEEPTPACVRRALGPTPQKDGAVLGIFDMLSAGTPSKDETRKTHSVPEALVSGTPTKANAPPSSELKLSKTPQSSGKRYYLDAFNGTPLKRKRDESDHSSSTSKKLFATPSFLRRTWPLSRIEEDTDGRPARAAPPFKKRPLVRSLSTMIQSLKKQEEDRMDDEWAIMNELEAEDRGEITQPAAPPKVLVEDSQAPETGREMPLGPDQGAESSEDEGELDPGALDANGNPRKVWKKKGLKRQTRRVIMRPVLQKTKSAPSALDRGGGDDNDVVEETQAPEQPGGNGKGEDDDFVDDEDEECGASDAERRRDSQQSRHRPAKKESGTKGKDVADATKEKEKKTKKVKPDAHANFRKLKIKNKNSKANGRGRFGRR